MTGLAAASLAFTCACAACLVYLHLAPTRYSPVRNAVSEYGIGRYGRWYRAQAACTGVAAFLLAGALRRPALVLALLVVVGVARLAIGRYTTDALGGGGEATRAGGVHLLLAAVAFTAAPWAAVALKRPEGGQPALGWAMAACALATMVFLRNPPLRRWFGAVERCYYVTMLAWLALVAVRLL